MGAEAGPPVEHEDTYLNHPSRDFAATNEGSGSAGWATSNAITYKGPKRAGPTKTREEIEVPFARRPGGPRADEPRVRGPGLPPPSP